MKAPPNVTDLAKHLPQDPVSKTAAAVKKAEKQSGEMPRKTYVLGVEDVDYINAYSLKLGQKRGQNVSASEALREIIAEHKKGGKK